MDKVYCKNCMYKSSCIYMWRIKSGWKPKDFTDHFTKNIDNNCKSYKRKWWKLWIK